MDEGPLSDSTQRIGKAEFVQTLEAKPEFKALSPLVRGSDASVTDAIRQIKDLTSAAAAKSAADLGNHCYDTACVLLELAERTTPEEHSGLVEFVRRLLEVTVNDPNTNEPLQHDGETVWKGLPTVGYTFVDELGGIDPYAADKTLDEVERWENETAFFARLSPLSESTDMSIWGLTALTYAFGSEYDDESIASKELAIRLACLWYIYGGSRLWENVQAQKGYDDEDPPDWDQAEWNRWKNCLVEAKSAIGAEGTKHLIDDALAEINRLEAK